jgi:uncharacterized protein (TIGR04255 family)
VPRQARRSSKYDLVSFEHPPVAEVALSVQFPPDTVDVEALGLFGRAVRRELPVRQRQPIAPPMVETFDLVPLPQTIEIHLEGPTSLPRTWFLSEDGVQLVQLQHDRMTMNWRELDRDVDYPRYVKLRERFEEILRHLTDALDELGQPHPVNLCEVTYVNPVDDETPRTPAAGHPDLAKIINRLRTRPRDAFLPEAEDAQLQARWRIPAQELAREDPPGGRLYLSAAPGFKPPENAPIYLVNLTARVIPSHGDSANVLQALDVGHKWVVLGFKDLTTPRMHKRWGLKEQK